MQDRLVPEDLVPAIAVEDRPPRRPTRPEEARIHRAERSQVEFFARPLDAIIPLDHPARAVWAMGERLDLTAFYAPIESFPDGPGRPASDPKALLALTS